MQDDFEQIITAPLVFYFQRVLLKDQFRKGSNRACVNSAAADLVRAAIVCRSNGAYAELN